MCGGGRRLVLRADVGQSVLLLSSTVNLSAAIGRKLPGGGKKKKPLAGDKIRHICKAAL